MLSLVTHTVNYGTRLSVDGASVSPSIRKGKITLTAGIPMAKNDMRMRRPPIGDV
ncbi:hypothetical protein JOD24_002436 [Kroppenstedtia sanguinis]|uniref:Uncharacterized protein n=1 Tax=Kroppenstedtia sanguinis TaxID=1380684 RepID=A0ABW4CCG5_9BACL